MKNIPDNSIDFICCDLPYGTTACKWDFIIPMEDYIIYKNKQYTFDECLKNKKIAKEFDYNILKISEYFQQNSIKGLWSHYNRIIKDNGAIALFATNPFATKLINSNLDMYRYEWVWDKTRGSNFQQANYCPMKSHEFILMFSKLNCVYSAGKPTMNYYPQKTEGEEYISNIGSKNLLHSNNMVKLNKVNTGRFPLTILTFKKDGNLHPTQKPVILLEYLVKTYTQEGQVVLDNCMGSGSTGIACINTNRNFIGIELDEKYFSIAEKRINDTLNKI